MPPPAANANASGSRPNQNSNRGQFGNRGRGNFGNNAQQRPRASAYQTSHNSETDPAIIEIGSVASPEENTVVLHHVDENSYDHLEDPNTLYYQYPENDLSYAYNNEAEQEQEQYYDGFTGFVSIETACVNCDESFSSKTKLHKHLRSVYPGKVANSKMPQLLSESRSLIPRSDASDVSELCY